MTNKLYLNDDGSIDQTMMDLGRDWLAQTISSGAIVYNQSMVQVDTEGSAAADDLETITISDGGAIGRMILMRPSSGDRIVTVKHATGNIWSPSGDVVLDGVNSMILLVWNGSAWVVVASSNCCGGSAAGSVPPLESGDIDDGNTIPCVSAGRILALIQLMVETAKAAVSGTVAQIALALNPIFGLVGVSDAPAVLDIAAQFKALVDSAGIDAVFTSDVYDTLLCYLFCSISADGNFTLNGLGTLLDFISGSSGAAWDLLTTIVTALGTSGLNNAIGTSGLTSNDCSGCSDCEWCYTFDFTASDGGFAADPSNCALYSAGTGWQQDTCGGGLKDYIFLTTLNAYSLTAWELTYTAVNNDGTNIFRFYEGAVGGSPLIDYSDTAGEDGNFTDRVISDSVSAIGRSILLSWAKSSGSVTYARLTLHGTGPNPFGEDNC